MKLFIRRNDKDYGPYPIEQIKQLLNEGRLLKNDQASEDKNIWQELDLFLARINEPPNLEDLTKLSPKETSTRNETANLQPIAKVAKTIAPHKEEHKTNPKEETTESARIDKPKNLQSNKSQEKTSGLNKKTKSKKKLLLMFLSSCIIFTGVACYFLLNGGKIIQREVPLDALKQDGNFFYAYKEDKPFTGIGFSEFPNGQKDTVTTFKGGKPDGLSEVWWENGNLKYSLNFQNGLLHGTNKAWHQNGQKLSEGSTVGGKKEGNWEFWSDNGTKIKTVEFLNDQKEGLFQEWDANGQKITEGSYTKDLKVGAWQEWHSNGDPKRQGNFIDGKEDGLHKSWKANVLELKSESQYEYGEMTYLKSWLITGTSNEGPIKNEKMEGKWITYDKEGIQMWSDFYKDGEMTHNGMAILSKKKNDFNNIINNKGFRTFIDRDITTRLYRSIVNSNEVNYSDFEKRIEEYESQILNIKSQSYDDSICYKEPELADSLIKSNEYLVDNYPKYLKYIVKQNINKIIEKEIQLLNGLLSNLNVRGDVKRKIVDLKKQEIDIILSLVDKAVSTNQRKESGRFYDDSDENFDRNFNGFLDNLSNLVTNFSNLETIPKDDFPLKFITDFFKAQEDYNLLGRGYDDINSLELWLKDKGNLDFKFFRYIRCLRKIKLWSPGLDSISIVNFQSLQDLKCLNSIELPNASIDNFNIIRSFTSNKSINFIHIPFAENIDINVFKELPISGLELVNPIAYSGRKWRVLSDDEVDFIINHFKNKSGIRLSQCITSAQEDYIESKVDQYWSLFPVRDG